MKRFTIVMVVGIALAAVAATVVYIWILRATFRAEAASSRGPFLRFSISRVLDAAERALELTSDPAALAERLEMPVVAGAFQGEARSALRLPAEAGHLAATLYGTRGGILVGVDGPEGPLTIGPVPRGSPMSPERLAVGLGIALVVGFIVTLIATVPLARGLDRLRTAARQLADGDLGARAAVRGGPTREVAVAFNRMAERTQGLLESQRHLLQAVSHELRTPTARIRFALQMLQDAKSDEARARRIAAIDDDLVELDALVEELLTATRTADGALGDAAREAVELGEIVGEVVDAACQGHPGVRVAVRAKEGEVYVVAVPHLVHRALRNLVLNACRHAIGRVVVSYEAAAEGGAVIAVSDDGPGVPEPMREQIFEPFFRVDESRNRGSGGFGLGLAIVRRIAEQHGGDVAVGADPELGGARFTLTLLG